MSGAASSSTAGRVVIAMSSQPHKRTRGNVFEQADDDVSTASSAPPPTSSPRSLLRQAEQPHAEASELAVSGKLSGALWRWHDAIALVSAAECAVPPRIAILVHDAIAQAHLALANDFAAIASAQAAIEAAEANAQRCASATLTLARAQRNLGELSMATVSYALLVQMRGAAEVVLALDDEDTANVEAESADVMRLLDEAKHKQSFNESDAAPMVPLREGVVLVADPEARAIKHRHIDEDVEDVEDDGR